MAYRIMEVKSVKENYGSLYAFKTQTIDKEVQPIEFKSKVALDEYVEDLLNNKGYAKSDFIIVSVEDYTVSADIANNTETPIEDPENENNENNNDPENNNQENSENQG